MRPLLIVSVLAAGCATAQVSDGGREAAFPGLEVEPVRAAAQTAVREVTHASEVRIAGDGSVVIAGHIGVCGEDVTCNSSPAFGTIGDFYTTITVDFRHLGEDTIAEVEIVYEDCPPRLRHRCSPQRLASTGALERAIIDRMRTELE